MSREFRHSPHGDTLHDLAIMVGKKICAERGYTFRDPRGLKDKAIYPGVPDIYIRRNKRTPNGAKVIHGYEDWIVEIESKPTKASVEQKIKQFSGDGVTDLIIVDLRLLTNGRSWKEVALGEFVEFMEERIP